MDKFDMEECTAEEVAEYKEKYNLKHIKYNDYYHTISINGISRALISIGRIEDEDAYIIDEFEVFEKGKGYGTKIINNLKEEKLMLYPIDSAKEFWIKNGFDRVDPIDNLLYRNY